MSKEFLDYYSDNLSFIRKLGAEFALEFPKIASRLDMNALECQDPFIERLLEGTAFLSARVEQKLALGYRRLLESILVSICPCALAPIPAICSVKVSDSDLKGLQGGSKNVLLNTIFKKKLPNYATDICFQSLIKTRLHSLVIEKSSIVTHSVDIANLSKKDNYRALELDLLCVQGATFSSLDLDILDIYLNLNDQDASALSEQLLANLDEVYLKTEHGDYIKLKDISLEMSVIDSKENAMNSVAKIPFGLNLLHLYMANSDLYKFLRIKGLEKNLSSIDTTRATLVFVFNKEHDIDIENRLQSDSIINNTIPLINLFKKRSNRHFMKQQYEVNVNVDATNPLDYEIYSIESLEFFNESNESLFNAYPFFTVHSKGEMNDESYRNFFSVNRRARQNGLNGNKRSPYNKQEVFITVSGSDYLEQADKQLQFSAQCYCTNADLPLFLNSNDYLSASDFTGIKDVQIINQISRPHAPLVTGSSVDEFKKMSFILQNLNSLLSAVNEASLYNLKQIIRSFSTKSVEETRRLVGAIENIDISDIAYRFISKGCVYFENGYKCTITFSQKNLEGVGLFIFSKMIVALLQSYSRINIPISVDIYSDERGFVYSCKTLKE